MTTECANPKKINRLARRGFKSLLAFALLSSVAAAIGCGRHDNAILPAVEQLHLSKFSELEAHGDQFLRDWRGNSGNTLIHYAETLQQLEFLHQAGVPINTPNDFGNCPLHFFAYNGDVPLADKAIQLGADVNRKGQSGETPVFFALSVYKGRDDAYGGIDRYQNGMSHTFSEERIAMLRCLIAAGAELDLRSDRGWTPLDMAEKHTSIDAVTEYLRSVPQAE